MEPNHIICLHIIYGCFLLQQQDLVIETQQMPTKPKIFALWPFTGKQVQSLVYLFWSILFLELVKYIEI